MSTALQKRCSCFFQNRRNVRLNFLGNVRLVHRINVHVRDTVGIQINDLIRRVGDSCLLHGRRIAAETVNEADKAMRHERAGEFDRALNLCGTCDRHNAGDNGHRNSRLADFVKETVQKVIIKRHLRCQKIKTGIHFFLQIADILSLIGAFGMHFRVTCAADTEICSALLEIGNQIDRIAVCPAASVLPLQFGGQISAERHDVFNPRILHRRDLRTHAIFRRGHTGQMGKHWHAVGFFDILCDIQRVTACAAACSIGYTHKRGAQSGNFMYCCLDAFKGRGCFRWKNLKGHRRVSGRQYLFYLHMYASVVY